MQTFDVTLMWLFCFCYLVTLVSQGRRHSRYLLTSNSQRELLKEAGNEIDHGWVSSKLIHSFSEQLKSWIFFVGRVTPASTSNTSGKRQDTRCKKCVSEIFDRSSKIRESFERQKSFQLILNLFTYPPGLTLTQSFFGSGSCLGEQVQGWAEEEKIWWAPKHIEKLLWQMWLIPKLICLKNSIFLLFQAILGSIFLPTQHLTMTTSTFRWEPG